MALHEKLKIRYNFNDVYPGTWNPQGVGATATSYKRGWYPQLPVFNGSVEAFCRVKKWLYIGGQFTTATGPVMVNGALVTQTVALPYLCRISLEDGSIDTSFNLGLNAKVAAMATDGENLYLAGSWTAAASIPYSYALKLDVNGAVVTAFDVQADAICTGVAVRTGDTSVYLIGSFTVAGGEVRDKLAEVGADGLATAFDAGVFAGGIPLCITYNLNQDMLYIGGTFTSVNGGTGRNRLAKLDADTGTAESWNPSADGEVRDIVLEYPLVYVGGTFNNIGVTPQARGSVAALDQAGECTAWNISVQDVNSLGLDTAKRILYAAGENGPAGFALGFDLDAAGSATQLWDANPDDAVLVLLSYKSSVFLGGDFTSVDGIGDTTVTNAYAATVPYPLFRDADTMFVKQTGSYDNTGNGNYADPKRTILGAIGTSQSWAESSARTSALSPTTQMQFQHEGWTKPRIGSWMAGPFDDVDVTAYLTVPAAVGNQILVTDSFAIQWDIWIEDLSAINTIWYYTDATAVSKVYVNTDGSLSFNIHGTTHSSAAGVIQTRGWYTVAVEKNLTGTTKKAWVTKDGNTSLVINTTQAVTMAAHVAHVLGVDSGSSGKALKGFMGPVFYFDAAGGTGLVDWRQRNSAIAYYPMQTLSAAEGDLQRRFICILDSETYEETFNHYLSGVSIYANEGCKPVISPRVGAKPGTYGARSAGREKAPGGTPTYISKTGSDTTGTYNDATAPFKTIAAALAVMSAGEVLVFQDSGVYEENVNSAIQVSFQATAGQVPTIAQSGSTTAVLQGRVSLYGMVIRGNAAATGTAATFAPSTGSVEIYDSSFSNVFVSLAVASAAYTVKNCFFSGYMTSAGGGLSFTGTGSVTCENCSFAADAVVIASGAVASFIHCTVTTQTGVNGYAYRGGATAASATRMNVLFTDCLAVTVGTEIGFMMGDPATGGSYDNKNYNILRCKAQYAAAGTGFYFKANVGAGVTASLNLLNNLCSFKSCLAECVSSSSTGYGFRYLIATTDILGANVRCNPWSGFSDCVSVAAGTGFDVHGIKTITGSGGGTNWNGIRTQVVNCSALTSVTYGVRIQDVLTAPYVRACMADGGATGALYADAALTALYCTGSTKNSNFGGTGVVTASPGFISNASGNENAGLSYSSPGLFSGSADRQLDQGANWAWVSIQGTLVTLNGLAFTGPINMGAGVENVGGGVVKAEFLQLSALGLAGIIGREGFTVEACEGRQCNGPAFHIGGVSASVTRSIAWGGSGAGFLYGASDLTSEHNSTWGCEAGHYDTPGANGSLTAEVHSDNGLDVQANENVAYSDVGTIGDYVVVDSTSVRTNPLYRDPYNGDLRLQTLEAGYPFQSPAKGRASDSTDAGAYEAEYGALSHQFTQVNFGDYASWTNPDNIPEILEAIKVAEGDKPSGKSFSSAKAFKRRWELNWNPENPMPLEQRIALTEFYRATGSVEVAFDGCTFIACTVQKSNELMNNEVGGAYTSTDMDRPIGSIVLQED